MIQLIKLMLYLITAHIIYDGFDTDEKLLDFITLMSCYLLIDICSFHLGRFTLLQEMDDDEFP